MNLTSMYLVAGISALLSVGVHASAVDARTQYIADYMHFMETYCVGSHLPGDCETNFVASRIQEKVRNHMGDSGRFLGEQVVVEVTFAKDGRVLVVDGEGDGVSKVSDAFFAISPFEELIYSKSKSAERLHHSYFTFELN